MPRALIITVGGIILLGGLTLFALGWHDKDVQAGLTPVSAEQRAEQRDIERSATNMQTLGGVLGVAGAAVVYAGYKAG